MLNPILFTENVIGDFLKYQLTTYAFADPDLYAQMRRLLNLDEMSLPARQTDTLMPRKRPTKKLADSATAAAPQIEQAPVQDDFDIEAALATPVGAAAAVEPSLSLA